MKIPHKSDHTSFQSEMVTVERSVPPNRIVYPASLLENDARERRQWTVCCNHRRAFPARCCVSHDICVRTRATSSWQSTTHTFQLKKLQYQPYCCCYEWLDSHHNFQRRNMYTKHNNQHHEAVTRWKLAREIYCLRASLPHIILISSHRYCCELFLALKLVHGKTQAIEAQRQSGWWWW